MQIARVSFTDAEGVEHAVTVEAKSLYHAIGTSIARFRQCGSGEPGPSAGITVESRMVTAVRSVKRSQFDQWLAREGGSPADVFQRSELRELLMNTEPIHQTGRGRSR